MNAREFASLNLMVRALHMGYAALEALRGNMSNQDLINIAADNGVEKLKNLGMRPGAARPPIASEFKQGLELAGGENPPIPANLEQANAIAADKRKSSDDEYRPVVTSLEMRPSPAPIQSPENWTPFEDFDGPCGAD